MIQYTELELAQIVQRVIRRDFDTPEKVLQAFKVNIKRKVTSLYPRKLTDNEIGIFSLKVATAVFENMHQITTSIICQKLSQEIISKSLNPGIEIGEYESYFNEMAKELVKRLLQKRYNQAKQVRDKSIRKIKRKK